MILNGQYTKGIADLQKLKSRQSSTWKQHDHRRQRSDYASEIVQPFTREGKPSEAFIDNYPEESVTYGFVKSEAEIIGNDSGTEVIDTGAQEVFSDEDRIVGEIPEEYYEG
jgi:hypothetical protein